MEFFDISMSIKNNMWSYRKDWYNEIKPIVQTSKGDKSTVYRFHLCSHTGTYIETSQHKLNSDKLLDDLKIDEFYRKESLLVVLSNKNSSEKITLEEFKAVIDMEHIDMADIKTLIISVGWGENENSDNYIEDSPYFERKLTDFLMKFENLGLLGVDIPVIDYQKTPYNAVNLLFENDNDLLLLAPVNIPKNMKTGFYTLICQPLKVENVSGSLCRPLLVRE